MSDEHTKLVTQMSMPQVIVRVLALLFVEVSLVLAEKLLL